MIDGSIPLPLHCLTEHNTPPRYNLSLRLLVTTGSSWPAILPLNTDYSNIQAFIQGPVDRKIAGVSRTSPQANILRDSVVTNPSRGPQTSYEDADSPRPFAECGTKQTADWPTTLQQDTIDTSHAKTAKNVPLSSGYLRQYPETDPGSIPGYLISS